MESRSSSLCGPQIPISSPHSACVYVPRPGYRGTCHGEFSTCAWSSLDFPLWAKKKKKKRRACRAQLSGSATSCLMGCFEFFLMTRRFNGQTNKLSHRWEKESRKLLHPKGSFTFTTERCVRKQKSLTCKRHEKHIPTITCRKCLQARVIWIWTWCALLGRRFWSMWGQYEVRSKEGKG